MATVVLLADQKNRFKNKGGITARGTGVVLIDSNKHDTQYLPEAVRGMRVNAAGDVAFTVFDHAGVEQDITRAFAAGEVWDYATIIRVKSTGTTATGIDGII